MVHEPQLTLMFPHLAAPGTTLCPPKANEFEIAERRAAVAGASGAGLAGHVVEIEFRVGLPRSPSVGGDHAGRAASRTVATASTAPAAPSRWPIADLVDETGISLAPSSPSARLSAAVSAASLSCVEVPCALT